MLENKMEWQPIETAPKDGTYVLTLIFGFLPSVSKFDNNQWLAMEPEDFCCEDCWDEYIRNTAYHPTHWMPLPDAPK